MQCQKPYCDGTYEEISPGKFKCLKCKDIRVVSWDIKREIAGVS